jgi:hypothetical protein
MPGRALSDCNEALRIDPGLAVADINRGNVYLNKADFESTLADFNDRSEKRMGLQRQR